MGDLEVDEAPAPATADCSTSGQRCIGTKEGTCNPALLWPAGPELLPGVRVGVLVGIMEDGRVPLVVFPGQRGTAAIPARATVDIHGGHIGSELVLVFEDGDACRPIVVGCLSQGSGWPTGAQSSQVEINADGQRLVVGAKERLVLPWNLSIQPECWPATPWG
jgi:hypothetical protein